jgi:hypothetical protein
VGDLRGVERDQVDVILGAPPRWPNAFPRGDPGGERGRDQVTARRALGVYPVPSPPASLKGRGD